MKTFATRALAVVALSVAAAAPLSAQELKIGYVNSERVLREALPAKAAQAKLEAEFGKRERELNEAATRLKAAADKLDKGRAHAGRDREEPPPARAGRTGS
jgi:outer membrane protein